MPGASSSSTVFAPNVTVVGLGPLLGLALPILPAVSRLLSHIYSLTLIILSPGKTPISVVASVQPRQAELACSSCVLGACISRGFDIHPIIAQRLHKGRNPDQQISCAHGYIF